MRASGLERCRVLQSGVLSESVFFAVVFWSLQGWALCTEMTVVIMLQLTRLHRPCNIRDCQKETA